jgi:bifunctional enzyme CysN/CysC
VTVPANDKSLLRIAVVGHLDHGKSTLIGRLGHELGTIKDPHLARFGDNWAFAMDQLREERDGGLTIDTAQTFLETADRQIVLIDVPGHQELLHNMLTGATQAEVALLVLAADEGVRDQTRRHIVLLRLLGLSSVLVAVNKMDLIGFSEQAYQELVSAVQIVLASAGVAALGFVPVSAKAGDNVVSRSERMGWYRGKTLFGFLSEHVPPRVLTAAVRFPVQDVYRSEGQDVIAGRLLSGRVAAGDKLTALPAGHGTTVSGIHRFPANAAPGEAGESIGLILAGATPDRGAVLTSVEDQPNVDRALTGRVFWLGEAPLQVGETLSWRCATQLQQVTVQGMDDCVDSATLEPVPATPEMQRLALGNVRLAAEQPLVFESFTRCPGLGRFVLERRGVPVGIGIVP